MIATFPKPYSLPLPLPLPLPRVAWGGGGIERQRSVSPWRSEALALGVSEPLPSSGGSTLGFVISDFSLPISEFKRLNLQGYRFIITENKMNFLTLPALSNSFALLGMGFQVAMLKDVDWLTGCPIVYWGDLDAQGFQILSMLRCYLPQTVSVMMDRETFDAFQEFSVPGTVCNIANLPYLTPEEHEMFASLSKQTRRLEQEKISQDFVICRFDMVL